MSALATTHLSGRGADVVFLASQSVKNNGIDGVLVDYEPLDVSLKHAQLFASWLTTAAQAMHAIPVQPGQPPKELGVNIADWSIIGPGFWHLYNASGVDFTATMTPTYSETARDWPFLRTLAQSITPTSKLDIGMSSALRTSGPTGGRCRGAPFNATFNDWAVCNTTNATLKPIPYPNCPWNESSLTAMLNFASDLGITHASVWRGDIDDECFNGTQPFMYSVLAKWIAGAQA